MLFEHACVEDVIQMIIKGNIHNQYALVEPYKKWLRGHVEVPDKIITDVRKNEESERRQILPKTDNSNFLIWNIKKISKGKLDESIDVRYIC